LQEIDYLKYDIANLAYSIRPGAQPSSVSEAGEISRRHIFSDSATSPAWKLNPIFSDILKEQIFRDYNHLADLPGVNFAVDDARRWFSICCR